MEPPGFGQYITMEYGLLRQILSYLSPCDLLNARLVCREWCNAVDSIVEKNPVLLTWNNRHEHARMLGQKPIIPALVIHTDTGINKEKCAKCRHAFMICPCVVSVPNTLFVAFYKKQSPVPENPLPNKYLFWPQPSALLIPSSPKIRVSTFYAPLKSPIYKEPVTEEVVDRVTGGSEPIKCLIIISKDFKLSLRTRWFNQLFDQIVLRQGLTFAVGGGVADKFLSKKGSNERWKKPGVMLITFRGDNVSAHADIMPHETPETMEVFLQELASRVGDVPAGGSRVAFIAQCVARNFLEECESPLFRKAFPLVPQFGFRAYGEYGLRSSSEGDCCGKDSRKRIKVSLDHTYTTSFVILTFSKT